MLRCKYMAVITIFRRRTFYSVGCICQSLDRSCVLFFLKLSQVIGALQVQNYALFVSHKHPDGHVSLLRTIYCFFCPLNFTFSFSFVIYRLISMSFRLKRKDVRGERSQLIRTSLMGVAVLATMSPFVRKAIVIAEFPW